MKKKTVEQCQKELDAFKAEKRHNPERVGLWLDIKAAGRALDQAKRSR